MASQRRTPSPEDGKTYFEEQREILIGEIATSFEHALANINKLNRSLEAIITVGNEFSSVEALWSQFEGVMGKDEQEGDSRAEGEGEETRDDEGGEESRDNGEEGYEQEEDEDENESEGGSVVEDRGRR